MEREKRKNTSKIDLILSIIKIIKKHLQFFWKISIYYQYFHTNKTAKKNNRKITNSCSIDKFSILFHSGKNIRIKNKRRVVRYRWEHQIVCGKVYRNFFVLLFSFFVCRFVFFVWHNFQKDHLQLRIRWKVARKLDREPTNTCELS